MELLDVGRIVVGLVLLVAGGELLVRGASALALRLGLSSFVVGLTVVSVATSAPEFAVTLGAVLSGETDLAVGNVVGSNIANILLILGISALVLPLVVRRQLLRLDLPVLLVLSVALLVLSLDGRVSTLDGALLLAVVVVYTTVIVIRSRRSATEDTEDTGAQEPNRPLGLPVALVLVGVGVGLLVLGARLLVDGAVGIATGLGVSGLVVGLTVVAVGTSLPELIASIIAVRKGEGDLAVGNAVGSCIFNIGLVLGFPAIIASGGLEIPAAAVALDIPLMIAAAAILLPLAYTASTVVRWEAVLLVLLYLAYTAYVVLAATDHDALTGFSAVMVLFVLPLVALGAVALAIYEKGVRAGRASRVEGPQV